MGAFHRVALAGLAICACTVDRDEPVSVDRAAIAGGVDAPDDAAVVGIYDDTSGAQCTGSLIAPNVVLTAQHCVAELPPGLECGVTTFGPAKPPTSFYVTTLPFFSFEPGDYHAVSSIRVPTDGNTVCGYDIALLILASPIAAAEAVPLVPRVEVPASAGEIYAAIGYGATDDNGTGAGERRRRDGLTIDCAPGTCAPASAAATEWVGEAGVCQGDSGGPAIDEADQVIGVASRGSVGCTSPIYGDVAAHADWIKEQAIQAADAAGYPVPAWAGGPGEGGSGGESSTGGAAMGGASQGGASGNGGDESTGIGGAVVDDPFIENEEEEGCSASAGSPDQPRWILLAAIALWIGARRRRRGT